MQLESGFKNFEEYFRNKQFLRIKMNDHQNKVFWCLVALKF